jgi:Transcriptional regulator containing an amidase domain and an AraC-type DNA-binding HTH domain
MAQLLLPAAAAQKWSLDEIASHLGVNRDHLLRLFRKQGVPSPMRQLRKLVLAALIPRLMQGCESVEELAQEAGYADASSLRRAFRRAYGKPPSAIRLGSDSD